MKKLLGILVLTALATSLYAQGTVGFANATSLGPVKKWTSTTDSTLVAVPKTVAGVVNARVQLLAAYDSTTASLVPLFETVPGGVRPLFETLGAYLLANPGWAAYTVTGIGTLQNGGFNGGTVTLGPIDGVNGNEGLASRYAVLGWGSSDASFDLALAGGSAFLGLSQVFSTGTGNPLATPPGTATSLNTTFGGVTLAPNMIPEPSSFALAGLGIASLLILRRRK